MHVGPEPEDLTARARIRHAALLQFGEHGFDRATIRGIADAAGVSSGLVRHHFGSKEALRDACDEYLIRVVTRLNEQAMADGVDSDINYVAAATTSLGPYRPYLARSLVNGGTSVVFDEIVTMTEQWLVNADADRPDPPDVDRHSRATVITAMALSTTVLYDHVCRGLGVDVFTPAGVDRLARVLIDFYSHPLLSLDAAAVARARLDRAVTDLHGATHD